MAGFPLITPGDEPDRQPQFDKTVEWLTPRFVLSSMQSNSRSSSTQLNNQIRVENSWWHRGVRRCFPAIALADPNRVFDKLTTFQQRSRRSSDVLQKTPRPTFDVAGSSTHAYQPVGNRSVRHLSHRGWLVDGCLQYILAEKAAAERTRGWAVVCHVCEWLLTAEE